MNREFLINPYWFFGKVEDRADPLELGRVRVRVYGVHTPDKVKDQFKGIPTDELFWAQPIGGVESANVSGVGETPNGFTEGAMVFGFFLDGDLAQDPFVIGTLAGMPVDAPDPTKGFNDPKGVYPRYLNESDLSRLARRAYTSHQSYVNKAGSIIQNVPTSIDAIAVTSDPSSADKLGPKWSEPESAQSTVYPYNHVRETESGHIQEFDDTPNAERMHWMHGPSGTYEEWRPDGSVSSKVNGDDTYIVVGDEKILIGGDKTVTILGNVKLLVQGNMQEQVNGNVTRLIKGNLTEKIEGNYSRDILGESATNTQGNVVVRDGSNRTEFTAINKDETIGANNSLVINAKHNVQCLGDWSETAASNYTHITGGNHNEMVGGNRGISVTSAYGIASATYSLGVRGNMTIDAAGNSTILGSRIDLN